ncbi:hypothetical protein VZO05_14335 [Aggregatilineales bacterium SYSU G02658]
MSFIAPLEHHNVTCHYDEATSIAYITYRGQLDAAASTIAYDWLAVVNETVGVPYGEVFDFRLVTQFMQDNLLEARKKSRRRNLRSDVHQFPVAMIVKDPYQEEILRGPMQIVPENPRKAIVHTPEEALAFIRAWHERHDETNLAPEDEA